MIVYPRICMRNLGDSQRGNHVADWICHFSEEVKAIL